jgi:S-DNA-T family DNA segregation ATPase FtsK/SpoIIIE
MTELQEREARAEIEVRPSDEVERAVLDAELVDLDEQPRPGRRVIKAQATAVITGLGKSGPVAATGRAVQVSARGTVRGAWVASQGGVSWAKRTTMALTHGHLREQVRLARAAGDSAALAEWSERLEKAKDARMKRLLELPRMVLAVLITTGIAVAAIWFLILAGGITVWAAPGGLTWDDWWHGVGVGLDVAFTAGKVAGGLVVFGLGPLLLILAFREGKRAADPPLWLLTPTERAQIGSEVTADSITAALAHVGIAPLSRALKEGAVLEFIVPPRAQGGGTYFQVRLPLGVAAAELLPSKKVELLAGNLTRHKHEVWPQRQPESDARVLDCWVADKGTMDQPAPPWPLLDEGSFDVFRDRLPWGVTMRSEPVQVGMLQKHWLIGANSKQGKTTALRTLLLGLALDPTVELRIADLKGDGDFDMLEPRCHTYICGQADEDAEAAVVMLEDLVSEMQRRYDEKAAKRITLTRELSRRRGSGFHPIYAIVDECQVMYMAGKAADGSQLGGSKDDARAQKAAKRLHDQARAVNIHLMQATQRPDPQTVPVRVREGAHVRASLYVPNINAARMILADAADRGARPYDLRAGRDAGTVVVAGEVEDIPLGQAFAIVRTHFVTKEQAQKVAARAIDAWRKHGRGGLRLVESAQAPRIDHLKNIRDALRGEANVRTPVVLGRLIEHDPDTYEEWSHEDLSKFLKRWNAPIGKSHGQSVVRLELVEQALLDRDGDGDEVGV